MNIAATDSWRSVVPLGSFDGSNFTMTMAIEDGEASIAMAYYTPDQPVSFDPAPLSASHITQLMLALGQMLERMEGSAS